jgi:CHASE2 domain-containing sensor protein
MGMDITRRNVGRIDRAIRIVLGGVLLGFALFCPWAAIFGSWVPLPSGLIGLMFLVIGVTRRCPGDALTGQRTKD